MIPEKMKAIIITEPRKAEVREITTPTLSLIHI